MSAKLEADVARLEKRLFELSTSMLSAVSALSERIDMIEEREGDAGDAVKAAPNGKAKRSSHR